MKRGSILSDVDVISIENAMKRFFDLQ